MHLMEEGPKNEEKVREAITTKEAKKEAKKNEKANKKIQDGIPEGVPKIGELYSTVDKDKRENKINTDNQTTTKRRKKIKGQ